MGIFDTIAGAYSSSQDQPYMTRLQNVAAAIKDPAFTPANINDMATLLTRLGLSGQEVIIAVAFMATKPDTIDPAAAGVYAIVRGVQKTLRAKGYPIPAVTGYIQKGDATDLSLSIVAGRMWMNQRWYEIAKCVVGALPYESAAAIADRAKNRADGDPTDGNSKLIMGLVLASGVAALIYASKKGL